ncbi:virulence factor TspB C-terminal domain-related protein [Methylomonas rivi]|uniref:Conjugal transfer protein TraN n=1 Tax=Methylomonas rivi TaxID=2952226 RepID=A0ABT1U9G9_9GAMM|nr:virulence factor TspB C-terminal domain-related protein [Methylomonas sp. WSC-6]MCQ8130465.1 hypothetical protein [Methylomonas sp. WSC-6]
MDISSLKKLIFIFLFLFFNSSFAVPVIFKTNKSILVRTPQGVVAKPGIGELLATVPGASSSVKATGSFPVALGSASVAVPVAKTYAASDIAATAADLILSRTALGLLATLALPYAIDAVTDQFVKQVPGDITPADMCQGDCQTQLDQCNAHVVAMNKNPYGGTYGYIGNCISQPASKRFRECISNSAAPGSCNILSQYWYYNYETPQSDYCTTPSVYDSATEMCIGSAINEPANATQLAADIEATFNDNPTFPKVALDTLLDHDIEPTNGDQDIDMPSPQMIQGETKTSTKNYHDPATGHPVTEETTEHTDYKVEKTGPNQLDVKPNVTTTLNITDNITNTTTTTTNITEITPSEATTETPPETDCDKYPDAVGCLELGDTGTPEELQTINVDVSINPASWGSGSCPADVAVAGHFMTGAFVSYAPVCQFLSSLAPALIGLGWLIAGWFVLGGVRD